jgi:hypothetical protein
MKTLIPVVTLVAAVSSSASAALVAAWDFQTTSNGGTAVAAAPSTPSALVANFGSGTLYLNGTNGASSWVTTNAVANTNEVTAFAGTSINANSALGMSTVTATGALALLGGASLGGTPANFSSNGKAIIFALNMSGFANLSVSYAAQRTATGFTSQVWETSTDGSTWTAWSTVASGTTAGSIATSFATSGALSLVGTGSLDNAATAFVRVTFSGATSSSGNNRLDNFIFNADVVPTPGAFALLGLAGLAARRRRH